MVQSEQQQKTTKKETSSVVSGVARRVPEQRQNGRAARESAARITTEREWEKMETILELLHLCEDLREDEKNSAEDGEFEIALRCLQSRAETTREIINLCIIYAKQIEERGGTDSVVTMSMLYPLLKGN